MRLAALIVGVCAASCGGTTAFNLVSTDNDAGALGAALAQRKLAAGPVGGTPRVYVVVSGAPKRLVAYDLAASKVAWTADANVASRIAVGGDFVVALEGKRLVGRDAASGKVRWQHQPASHFLGVAADARAAYVVDREDHGGRPTWWLTAVDGKSGGVIWRLDADGQLGAPAAQGGLVMSPFMSQWLSVVDARTGAPLARIRATEQQIAFVRTTHDAAWFGSAQGVFRLDARAASGTRKASTFGGVELPAQLADASYAPDAYDPVQVGYTALDRKRILWRGMATGDGPLALAGGGFGVHYFRFVFGYASDGALKWAYSHPRVELVASEHAGSVIAAVSATGDIVALDPATGAVRHKVALEKLGGQVLGATFDADGWVPSGEASAPPETVAALVSIARDRDARFDKVKELAVTQLAAMSGASVTADLLTVLEDKRAPARLKDAVVDVLMKRKDAAGLPALTAALARARTDTIDGVAAENVGQLARVVASLDAKAAAPPARAEIVAALAHHLAAPETEVRELAALAKALAVIGGPEATTALRTHMLLYRSDPTLAGSVDWRKAVVDPLAAGASSDRAAVRFVADDPRTEPDLAAHASELVRKAQ